MKLGLACHSAFDFQRARRAFEEGFALWQRAGEIQPAVPPPPAPHALRLTAFISFTVDPGLASGINATGVIEHLFSGLVELSPEMSVVPEVARSWEVSEGGRKYVFHLRDDVRWSDGNPVTAGDLEYAWKRVLDPAGESLSAHLLYDIEGARAYHQGEVSDPDRIGVRALDEMTLAVELEPSPDAPHHLSGAAARGAGARGSLDGAG
jgi:ABC-type oligopeptide transport system substrate-binding subunit